MSQTTTKLTITKTRAGTIAAVLAVVSFSLYTIFGKILIEHLSPHTVAAITQTISAVAVLLFFGALPELKKLLRLPATELVAVLLVGILSAVTAPLLLFKGLMATTATNAILIESLEPVFLGILATVWLRERMLFQQKIGMVVMFVGVYTIATRGFVEDLSFQDGDVLIAGASLAWATAEAIFKKYLHTIAPELVVLVRNIIGSVVLLVVVPLFFTTHAQHDLTALMDPQVLLQFVLFSLVVIVVGQFLWYQALERIPAARASAIALAMPLFGVFFAVTVLGEQLHPYHAMGGTMVFVGLILTVYRERPHPLRELYYHIRHRLR